ncbi:hypothetical protein Tco_0408294 [Tanacetum coccineum]
MRPFGCSLTILNTLDHLGKFDGKSEEGYLLGYSTNSKGFRVYNRVTRKVQDCLHVNFLENQENQKGKKGPDWIKSLFIPTQHAKRTLLLQKKFKLSSEEQALHDELYWHHQKDSDDDTLIDGGFLLQLLTDEKAGGRLLQQLDSTIDASLYSHT